MKRALIAILALGLISAGASVARADGAGPLRLAVRVFQIPAEQSFRIERPDGRGGTLEIHASGNVTANFPQGTVFIPTELAWNASESAIAGAIGRRVPFGSGDLAAGHVTVRELGSFDLDLDEKHPAEETRFEESRGEGRSADYRLLVEALSGGPGKPLVRLSFDAGSSWTAGSMAGGMSGRVIAAVAEAPESKLLLIGAPGDKAVYVLAVCALPR